MTVQCELCPKMCLIEPGQSAVSVSSGGEPRDVDMQRIRTMIRQKRLSDQEAEFYKKVE